MGPLIHRFFFPNKYVQYGKRTFFPVILLTFFPLAYFTVRIQNMIHITHKICANQLFMLSIWLLVNSRLLAVQFLGSQSHTWMFDCMGGGQASLTLCWSRVDCTLWYCYLCSKKGFRNCFCPSIIEKMQIKGQKDCCIH